MSLPYSIPLDHLQFKFLLIFKFNFILVLITIFLIVISYGIFFIYKTLLYLILQDHPRFIFILFMVIIIKATNCFISFNDIYSE